MRSASSVDLLGDARPPPIDDVDDFLEIEQPERQAQGARADDLGLVPGRRAAYSLCGSIRSTRVAFGRLQDAVEDQRDGARLAAAGRAEHREMLLQKILHAERRLDPIVLAELADRDRLLAGVIVDRLERRSIHLAGGGADRRIGSDAAVEGRLARRASVRISPSSSTLASIVFGRLGPAASAA